MSRHQRVFDLLAKSILVVALVTFTASGLPAQVTSAGIEQVRDDAKVVLRILEATEKDLPRDLMQKIVEEDIDILRGRQNDGTYLYANYVAEEADRKEKGFTIPAGAELVQSTLTGDASYAVLLKVPGRRFMVRRNQQVYIDRVDLDLTPASSGMPSRVESIEIGTWVAPGSERLVTFPHIARTARVTVHSRTDKEAGPASLQVILLVPRLSDDPRSPWYRPVENAKVLLREIGNRDRTKIESAARLIAGDPLLTVPTVAATTRRDSWSSPEIGPDVLPSESEELYIELRRIEELLSGNEFDRRQGQDMLQQLVRRLRPSL